MVELTSNQLLWVEELERTTRPQGNGWLSNEEGDCCLGIGCRVAIANGVEIDAHTDDCNVTSFDGDTAALPLRVMEWLDVISSDPMIGDHCASELNDSMGLTFKQIAARIRQYGLS